MTSDAERKAIRAANKLFGDVFANVLTQAFQVNQGPDSPAHGESRRNTYRYFESPDHRMFCWTPWKDSNGDYWTWVMKPFGRGAKTAPRQWKRVGKRVRSRTRKTAKKRAHTRYMNWLKYLARNEDRKRQYNQWLKAQGR